MNGSDIETAAPFAHAMGIQRACRFRACRRIWRRRNLHAQKDRMTSSLAFMQADSYQVISLVDWLSATLPTGSHDGTPLQLASLPAAADAFQRQGSAPQLGEAYPTNAEIEDIARFEERPYGSVAAGPSYCPDSFNETSRKTVQGVHPDLLKVVTRAREISDTDFEVVPKTGGVRSEALQQKLKAAGRSKAKDMKGFKDVKNAMARAAEEIDVVIQWGGSWKKLVDKPHLELDRKVYPAPGEEADPSVLKVEFR